VARPGPEAVAGTARRHPPGHRTTHSRSRPDPRPTDLAEALGTSEEQIREAFTAGQAYTATSLQRPVTQADGGTLADHLGDEESGYEEVETRQVLQTVVSCLPHRERRILGLRFYHQLTQSEIARSSACRRCTCPASSVDH
jgi:DNA-directed RNA polymerase specialized sigma subunit